MSDTEWGEPPSRVTERARAWREEDEAIRRAARRSTERLERADRMAERESRTAPSARLERRAERDWQDAHANVSRRRLERRVREGQAPVQGGERVDMGRWIPHPSRSSYGPPLVHPDAYYPMRQVFEEGARGEREAHERGGVHPRQDMRVAVQGPPRGERVVGRQPRELDMQPMRVSTEGRRAAESRRIREDKRRRARRQGRARGLVRALRRGR